MFVEKVKTITDGVSRQGNQEPGLSVQILQPFFPTTFHPRLEKSLVVWDVVDRHGLDLETCQTAIQLADLGTKYDPAFKHMWRPCDACGLSERCALHW